MAELAAPAPRLRTVDDFLTWADNHGEHFEFFDGVVRMMTSPSVTHEAIAANTLIALGNALRGGPCRPFGGSMSVEVGNNAPKADVTVSCTPESGDRLRAPVVIVEVLSPSTADADRGRKWTLYRTLPGLRHYLLLEQDRIAADLYTREGSAWRLTPLEGEDAVVALEAVGVTLRLGEVYEGVTFEGEGAGGSG